MKTKIPFYNILNMFLTGLVFIGGCLLFFPECALSLFNNEIVKSLGTGPEIVVTVCAFAIAYEVGLFINRVGSVIVERFLKWREWIPFNDDYVLFNNKKKKYPIMSILSREYALSRTGIALFFALLILALVAHKWPAAIACAIVVLIYYLSCRKHAAKIVELMKDEESVDEGSEEKEDKSQSKT